MNKIINEFFITYFKYSSFSRVYVEGKTPKKMIDSSVDVEGWYTWKPITGTLNELSLIHI